MCEVCDEMEKDIELQDRPTSMMANPFRNSDLWISTSLAYASKYPNGITDGSLNMLIATDTMTGEALRRERDMGFLLGLAWASAHHTCTYEEMREMVFEDIGMARAALRAYESSLATVAKEEGGE